MELKDAVFKIAQELNEIRPTNIGILDVKGAFIASNFSENSHNLISKIVKQYASIPINNYIKQDLPNSNYFLYIYKISTDVFIVCITNTLENLVLQKFGQITRDYGSVLLENLQPTPVQPKEVPLDKRIVAVAYSKTGDLGPTAVSWMPRSLTEQEIFEIAAKSLLILSAGFDRSLALHESSSVLPFEHGIGMVYVFSILDPRARGRSHDAAITLLLQKAYRKALLERLDLFERDARMLSDKLRGGGNSDLLIEQFYVHVSNSLDQRVEAFTSPQTQTVIPSDFELKQAMVNEVKRIQVEHPKSLDLDFDRRR